MRPAAITEYLLLVVWENACLKKWASIRHSALTDYENCAFLECLKHAQRKTEIYCCNCVCQEASFDLGFRECVED